MIGCGNRFLGVTANDNTVFDYPRMQNKECGGVGAERKRAHFAQAFFVQTTGDFFLVNFQD